MTILTEDEKTIDNFLSNENLPIDKYYVVSPSAPSSLSNYSSCIFIFPNKKVYLTTLETKFSKKTICLDSSFELKNYQHLNLNEKVTMALAKAINNPLKLDVLSAHFYFDKNFKSVVDAQNDIIKSIKEKEVIENSLCKSLTKIEEINKI